MVGTQLRGGGAVFQGVCIKSFGERHRKKTFREETQHLIVEERGISFGHRALFTAFFSQRLGIL